MEAVSRQTVVFNYEAERLLFTECWSQINRALPDGEAFRGKNRDDHKSYGPFSPALFEMISIGIATNIDNVKIIGDIDLRNKIVDLIITAKDRGLTGGGSNSRTKTHGRLTLAKEIFAS
jgi:hypothetical protein